MELKMCSSQLVLYFIISVSAVSAQGRESCDGRCGERYLRADLCHCDYNCMSYAECCPDYKSVCTTENSCKGRCHEGFIRGLACDCDPGCKDFGKCCPDYESACKKPTPQQPPPRSSEDPEPEARGNPPEPTKKPEDEMTKDSTDNPQKDKSNPPKTASKSPKKKKPGTIEESEEKIEGSNQKPQSPTDEKDGKPKEPKIKEPNKKRPGDNDPEDPANPPADPNQNRPVLKDDELRKPKTPITKEDGEDPKDTEKSPKGPTQKPRSPNNEKDEKPKDPKLKEPNQRRPGDKDPKDPDNPPEGLNQKPRSPSNEKDGKPKDPKNKEPTPEGSRASPGDKTNNPQKTKTPTVKEEEDKEANEDTDDNTSSSSNLKNTKKRSPVNTNKNPKKKIKPVGNTDDPFGDPSPDKGKKKRITIVPKKKKKRIIYIDEEDDDEPSKPGKGKKPKKKPSNKNIVKKKKVNSEEERQETVESEFSSSSQSSTSHSRSKKSKRRMTGKNKKNIKKIPEEPEQPLKPPKRKKDKKFPPTPEPTFISEGSGDEGSGMSTTMAATTLITQSPTTESQTTVGTKKTEATVIPSTKPQTGSTDVTSYKTTPSTPNLLTTGETHEKTSTTISPNTQTLSSQKATPSTPSTVSTEEQPAKTSTTISPRTQALASYKATSISNIVSTGQSVKTSTTMSTHTQSSTPQERTTGQSMMTNTPVQQMSTLKTPKDQSTTDSSDIIATTISEILQETTKSMLLNSTPVDPTKQTPLEDNNKYTTSKPTSSAEYSTTTKSAQTTTANNMVFSTTATPGKVLDKDITVATETTMKHSVHTVSTKKPEEELELSSPAKSTVRPEQTPTLTKRTIYDATTKPVNTKTPTPSMYSTKTTNPTSVPTARKMNDEEMGNNINITKLENPFHVCDLLKDEGIKLRISDHDLQLITDICMEMQQQKPPVSTPAPETRKPTVNYGNIPPRYTYAASNFNQQPETRIIEIVEEIYRRMSNSPVINITIVPGQNIYKPTVWLLLLNKIKSSYDPVKNLCIGKPADGMTTLQNGSMVVFRGNYFWTLNQGGVTESPRKISEVWGIPSPIDTVFTRCNCGAKTFFFKGPRYWRFTNDVMDQGYPKEITKGFDGLSGKVTAVLPVAGLNTRPESVYFFKTGGNVQKYTFRQEQSKKCIKKKRPVVQYPIYSQRVQTVRYRFPRNTVRHRIVIHRRISKVQSQQPLGILHEETTVRSTWRGVPNNIISAVSLANPEKQDGFDYFVFNKDKYYNINMSSKVAVKPPPESEQKTSKDWYKCKE